MLKRAQIVFRGGHNAVECVALDMSEGGACLRTSGLLPLPETFELRLDRAAGREVEVRYRTLDRMGVRFLAAG